MSRSLCDVSDCVVCSKLVRVCDEQASLTLVRLAAKQLGALHIKGNAPRTKEALERFLSRTEYRSLVVEVPIQQRMSALVELVAMDLVPNVNICRKMSSRLATLNKEMNLPRRRDTLGLHHRGCIALTELKLSLIHI